MRRFSPAMARRKRCPDRFFPSRRFLGAAMKQQPNGWSGALLCLAAIYLPSFLLVIGALPAWHAAQRHPAMRSGLKGVNAAVVGLLLAALYTPVWTSAIFGLTDVAIAAAALVLLLTGKVPSWAVVAFGAAAASALSLV